MLRSLKFIQLSTVFALCIAFYCAQAQQRCEDFLTQPIRTGGILVGAQPVVFQGLRLEIQNRNANSVEGNVDGPSVFNHGHSLNDGLNILVRGVGRIRFALSSDIMIDRRYRLSTVISSNGREFGQIEVSRYSDHHNAGRVDSDSIYQVLQTSDGRFFLRRMSSTEMVQGDVQIRVGLSESFHQSIEVDVTSSRLGTIFKGQIDIPEDMGEIISYRSRLDGKELYITTTTGHRLTYALGLDGPASVGLTRIELLPGGLIEYQGSQVPPRRP